MKKYLPFLAIMGAAIGGVIWIATEFIGGNDFSSAKAQVIVPKLSAGALAGQKTFNAVCAACHGPNGTGSGKGPPLIHDIYNPGHHDDGAFFRAVRWGAQAHHWRFGNMPPLSNVTEKQTSEIVQFIREVQRANGIRYRPHNM